MRSLRPPTALLALAVAVSGCALSARAGPSQAGLSGAEAPAPLVDGVAGRAGTTTIQVRYVEHFTGDDEPLENVNVRLTTASGAFVMQTRTDSDGHAALDCPASGERVDVSVYTAGVGQINVSYDPAGWIPFNESSVAYRVRDVPCGGARVVYANPAMANTLVAMREIEAVYASLFGRSRGPVDVYINHNDANGLYSVYNNISFGDEHLGLARGFQIMAHEYGHAFHHRALGGMPRGRCGASHYFDGADDFGCAYTEGFAQFAAAVAYQEVAPRLYAGSAFGDSANSAYFLRVLRNSGHPGAPPHSDREGYAEDGSLIEGAFAAFLWDLYDGAGSGEYPEMEAEAGYDRTSYPLSYIGEVIRTCGRRTAGRVLEEDGTDHLMSCFENRRVPYSPTLFRLRYEDGPDATDYEPVEGAAEPPGWSPDDIRALWMKTYYGLDTSAPGDSTGGP